MPQRPKQIERGYVVVALSFLLLVATAIYACWYQHRITEINYEIESLNYELAKEGIYMQIPPVTADFTLYNFLLTAENAVFAIVSAAQFSKKKMNNVYQYAEEWLDKWLSDPEVRPYVVQIVSSFIASNPNPN